MCGISLVAPVASESLNSGLPTQVAEAVAVP
jgi:hypothetical protein